MHLSKLSEEYIIPILSSTVENEVSSMSKSLAGASKEYVMELLELADTLKYQESLDLCVQHLVTQAKCLRPLLKDKKISHTSKNKLVGMMMQKRLEDAEKGLTQVDDAIKKIYVDHGKRNPYSIFRKPTSEMSSTLVQAIADLKIMAKDLTAR